MGWGDYSQDRRQIRAMANHYHTAPVDVTFVQNQKSEINEGMSPNGVTVREARDSEEHPNVVPIMLFLDVTGSMGVIPEMLIKDGLPTLVSILLERGIADPTIMFAAIGDHFCDSAPLQVGQFEASDEKLDHWLQHTWLEGHGGGNGGESYGLAWYFAANHTDTDAFNKRGKKGYVFTVGDEPIHSQYDQRYLKHLMGTTCKAESDTTAAQLLAAAKEKNHVFHLHIGQSRRLDNRWKELLGDNLIEVSNYDDLPKIIAELILKCEGVAEKTEQPSDKTESAPAEQPHKIKY